MLGAVTTGVEPRTCARTQRPPSSATTPTPPVHQASMMVQTKYDLPYSAILADADRTTRRIWGAALTIALAAVFRRSLAGSLRTSAMAAFSLVSTRVAAG